MGEVKVWCVFLGWISLLALIPTTIWFVILSIVAWGLNQSGLTGDWLHYWKYGGIVFHLCIINLGLYLSVLVMSLSVLGESK